MISGFSFEFRRKPLEFVEIIIYKKEYFKMFWDARSFWVISFDNKKTFYTKKKLYENKTLITICGTFRTFN